MDKAKLSEIAEKLKDVKSAEELLALYREYGVEMTEEKARALFNGTNTDGELGDDDLEGVAGGISWGDIADLAKRYGPDILRTLIPFGL